MGYLKPSDNHEFKLLVRFHRNLVISDNRGDIHCKSW